MRLKAIKYDQMRLNAIKCDYDVSFATKCDLMRPNVTEKKRHQKPSFATKLFALFVAMLLHYSETLLILFVFIVFLLVDRSWQQQHGRNARHDDDNQQCRPGRRLHPLRPL
jgi:hypothetical protein